ncbi:MAG: hypothetical protein H5T86_04365 [Armatimonadetes bacterium]|nr:hypothetical protein [Armatimonadota bacterium]
MRPYTPPEVRRSRLLMAAAGAAAAILAGWFDHWRIGFGLVVGLAAMAGVLELVRLRTAAIWLPNRSLVARVLHWLLEAAKYVVLGAAFWLALNVVRAPAWSLCAGVALGTGSVVAAFAMGRARGCRASSDVK